MNRLLMSILVLVGVAFAAVPANAVPITYSTSGSVAQVFLTPTSTGDIGFPPNSTFTLSEVLTFGDTSDGHYGQAFTFIPFTVSAPGFISASVSDLHLSDAGAKPLDWLRLELFSYTGSGSSYLSCGSGSSLCTLLDIDTDPPTASVAAALLVGTQYLLRVGFGLCGCDADYAGIDLTVATTPIPPAMLLFVSALLGLGGAAWRRRQTVGVAA